MSSDFSLPSLSHDCAQQMRFVIRGTADCDASRRKEKPELCSDFQEAFASPVGSDKRIDPPRSSRCLRILEI